MQCIHAEGAMKPALTDPMEQGVFDLSDCTSRIIEIFFYILLDSISPMYLCANANHVKSESIEYVHK